MSDLAVFVLVCFAIFGAIVAQEILTGRLTLASVGRNPKGEDREDGLRAEHEHAVGEAETPQ